MKKLITTVAVLGTLAIGDKVEAAHQVRSGDTLYGIATDHGISLEDIKSYNRQIKNPDLIFPGQTVYTNENEVVATAPQQRTTKPATETKKETKVSSANNYSSYELDLLARLIQAEALGESFEGKVAVGTVVLNRVKSSQFPNSIRGVIYQRNQFSPVSNGSINKTANAESIEAAKRALELGGSGDGSLYFYNPSIAQGSWLDSRQTVKVIGSHVFKK